MDEHDSDNAPDGSVDPEDLKNPDRSEEGQRRREHTGGDPDGREVAKRLYGSFDASDYNLPGDDIDSSE